jgi:hypothetical protein
MTAAMIGDALTAVAPPVCTQDTLVRVASKLIPPPPHLSDEAACAYGMGRTLAALVELTGLDRPPVRTALAWLELADLAREVHSYPGACAFWLARRRDA